MRNGAKARKLLLASQKGSASVIALLMLGGHPHVSISNRRVVKCRAKSFKTRAAIVLILDLGQRSLSVATATASGLSLGFEMQLSSFPFCRGGVLAWGLTMA